MINFDSFTFTVINKKYVSYIFVANCEVRFKKEAISCSVFVTVFIVAQLHVIQNKLNSS